MDAQSRDAPLRQVRVHPGMIFFGGGQRGIGVMPSSMAVLVPRLPLFGRDESKLRGELKIG